LTLYHRDSPKPLPLIFTRSSGNFPDLTDSRL
jgi:hypothetical protein